MTEVAAKVAGIVDNAKLAFNVGSNAGVKRGDKVTLWRVMELNDPDTKKELGILRMPVLNLEVIHVQETLCVAQVTDPVESDGTTYGIVVGGWRARKKVTSDATLADANSVFARVGDFATVYTRHNAVGSVKE